MLCGKPHDDKILYTEIEIHGKKKALKMLQSEIKKHEMKDGTQPNKELIMDAYSLISLIDSRVKLARSEKVKKESLESLDKTIRKAVEKENATHR